MKFESFGMKHKIYTSCVFLCMNIELKPCFLQYVICVISHKRLIVQSEKDSYLHIEHFAEVKIKSSFTILLVRGKRCESRSYSSANSKRCLSNRWCECSNGRCEADGGNSDLHDVFKCL